MLLAVVYQSGPLVGRLLAHQDHRGALPQGADLRADVGSQGARE